LGCRPFGDPTLLQDVGLTMRPSTQPTVVNYDKLELENSIIQKFLNSLTLIDELD